MYLKNLKIFLTIWLLISPFVSATPSTPEYQEITIQSKIFEQDKKVIVHLPKDYDPQEKHNYPVLYITDGSYYIDYTRAITDLLAMNNLMPKIIIVGLDHDNRVADTTPYKIAGRNDTGGADKFLDFVELDVISAIEDQFNVSNVRFLSGHSLGGLLTLHALHAKPGLFTAHFAFSPSLYWHDQKTVSDVKNYLSAQKALKQFVFINMGDEGYKGGTPKGKANREGFIELAKYLNQHNSTKYFWSQSMHTIDEVHGSTGVVGITKAFRTFYRNWNMPFRVSEQGVEAIQRHYESVSKDIFEQKTPSQALLSYHAGYLTHIKQEQKALALYQYITQQFPQSADAHFNLAAAYDKLSQAAKAKQSIATSIELSEEGSEEQKSYKEFAAKLQ